MKIYLPALQLKISLFTVYPTPNLTGKKKTQLLYRKISNNIVSVMKFLGPVSTSDIFIAVCNSKQTKDAGKI